MGYPFMTARARAGHDAEHREERNVVAHDAAEADPERSVADPSARFGASRKLSVFLMSRSAVAPLPAAALAPFAIAGATKLPYKEVFTLVRPRGARRLCGDAARHGRAASPSLGSAQASPPRARISSNALSARARAKAWSTIDLG